MVLPHAVNYTEALPALPDGVTQIPVGTNPVNGQTFTAGQQIQFDLLNRGFLVPDSMYISYAYSMTSSANVEWIGCPVYTTFNRLDVQVGSQTVDTIQNYNVVMHMLSNLTMDVAQKYGQQSSFGYYNSTGVPTLEQLDGRVCTANEQGSLSAPLMSILSNSDKLLPLFAMPQIRIVLTVESIANMFTVAAVANVPTAFTLSNVELRYKVIDMGQEVEHAVRMMGDKIYVKSQSFSSSSATLAGGSSGYMELVFNQRYASVKSLFAINGVGTNSSNKQFDSVDLTANTGEYSFQVGGVIYPQRPISTRNCRAQALQELRSAIGSVFDKTNSLAISATEFNFSGTAAACTVGVPGKFYIGTSTEKLGSHSLLTGISTQNSPISYRITSGQSIGANNSTVTLVVNYDAIWEIDLVNRQTAVKC